MNYRMIARLLGTILRIVAAFMAPPAILSLVKGEMASAQAFAVTVALMLALSVPLSAMRPRKKTLYAREGFALVGIGWIMLSVLGALPFWLSGTIPHFVDALFETVSGFTTTGASILRDVESLPKGMLYWRSFTHWLGGMGVLVFLLAVTPTSAASGDSIHIMRAESPGPQVGKLVPRTVRSAQILYAIYIGMTLVQTALMLAGGMPALDAVTTAFGTAGTGGFAIRNDSFASYSPYLQWVVTIFMALFGVNFGLYYLLLMREVKKAARNEEFRLYALIMIASTLIIFADILPAYGENTAEALRHAAFQVSSIMTTTGFATANFDLWPQFSRAILVLLMIVGASAGSTGGGVKCSRLLILVRSLRLQLRRLLHPNTVRLTRMDGVPVPQETVNVVYTYFGYYVIIALASTLLVTLDDFSLETSFTAVLACLNNIGPGLGDVGPLGNYADFSVASKLILSLNMLIGRLEIFPILILCLPSVWKRARA